MSLAVRVDYRAFMSASSRPVYLSKIGLQWGPADVQPLVLSPNWWTCMPRSALGSLPVISHVMVVGEDSEACSKVTVPVIFESPRTVATMIEEPHGQQGFEECSATIESC